MPRLGLGSGYDHRLGVREIAEWMRRAEDAGFELGFFSEAARVVRDGPSAMSAMALSTTQMTLGFVQVLHIRSPLVMAQTLATLDELAGGRIVLAPGACSPHVAARHSLPPFNPAQGLIESVEAIRLLLSGESVSYHGDVVNFDDVRLGWKPIRSAIPMYFAATSRRGLEIAGRMADGVLLDAVTSPEYSANAIRIIREAAEAEGRDWSQFVVAQIVNCSVEDDRRTAIDAIRWEVASKVEPDQHNFQRVKLRVGEPHMRVDDLPMFEDAWRRGGKEGLIKAVPDSYVEGMTASGTPAEVRQRVEQYRAAGVQLPILRPAAIHQAERLLSLFSPAAVA
jgi:alkanesulfonate monooxygenase SsuD/methylene tetrahydromethanopterin reductase-like flavin-dependent oxidoreductase (luciferase family)